MNIAELDDACGTQPNQRACNGLAFAICAPTDKCDCITGFEEYEGVCSCAEGDTLAEDEKSCQDGMYLIFATVASMWHSIHPPPQPSTMMLGGTLELSIQGVRELLDQSNTRELLATRLLTKQ